LLLLFQFHSILSPSGLGASCSVPIYGLHLYDEWESRNRTLLVGDRVNPITGVALVKRHYHLALKSGGVIAITRRTIGSGIHAE
jgi:hypothetical protein